MTPDPESAHLDELVRNQLVSKQIRDPRVLAAFRCVPRSIFVPESKRSSAYEDHPVPIGFEQTISQPYMAACMTEALAPVPGERILEIGTGSGYQTAILMELGAELWSIERIPELLDSARESLKRAGYPGAHLKAGDGTLGWPEEAPFDGIIVTAGAPAVPRTLVGQLREGGRMVIPVGSSGEQELLLIRREHESFSEERICSCVFVKLLGKEGWSQP